MTWRERRLITILSIILAVLSAAVLVMLGVRYRQARDVTEEDPAAQIVEAAKEVGSPYVALEYFNGSTTLAFDLTEEGAWVWRYDHDFPLDETTVGDILSTVEKLKPQQTLADHEELASYGLDSPDAWISVTTTEQTYITLRFGKSTTDGQSFYALVGGDEENVYIFSGALLELMKTPIYDMCVLPELPVLTDMTLKGVTLFGSGDGSGNVTRTTELKLAGGKWHLGEKDVSDGELVQALIKDVKHLTLERCVDYNPSDEAVTICGFETPIARVLISHRRVSGSEDETLLLTIANQLPDGSGRYVRVGDDTTIYFLPTELLDSMMSIAVNGLK